jgi:hypothetical protein
MAHVFQLPPVDENPRPVSHSGVKIVTKLDHNLAEVARARGRRILRINAGFLPVLMGRGVHHYSVFKNALPEDCRVVDASVNFRGIDGADELVLLLESDEWEPTMGAPVAAIKPSLVRHHCPKDLVRN